MTEELHEEVLDSLAELDKLCTVFDGASQEDVAYAKVFWSSLSLQPPIESRLVSADIRQRLRAAKTPHCECGVQCERVFCSYLRTVLKYIGIANLYE